MKYQSILFALKITTSTQEKRLQVQRDIALAWAELNAGQL